jgi:hypothetical protein
MKMSDNPPRQDQGAPPHPGAALFLASGKTEKGMAILVKLNIQSPHHNRRLRMSMYN